MIESFDVAVIGGGPGGSTAAGLLAQAGRKVVLFERQRFPRFRIGESLLPMSNDVYHRLGLFDEMERRFILKYGAQFIKGGDGREHTFEFKDAMGCPYDHSYHVPRAEHDQLLLNRAKQLGADVREGWMVEDVMFEGPRATGVVVRPERDGAAAGEKHWVRSRFVVDASGRVSMLAKKLRLREPVPGMNKTAVFSHYTGVVRLPDKFEGSPTICTFPGGWFWIIPFMGEITSVGAVMHHAWWRERKGMTADQLLDDAIAHAPEMQKKLVRAQRVRPVEIEGSFSYKARRFSGPGWVLCGDAAAFLDPVFSSGVFLTMRCGEDIADRIDAALERGDLSENVWAGYQRATNRRMKPFWKYIDGFYDEAFYNMLLRPTQRFQLVPAITGVLVGTAHTGWRFRWRLWLMDRVVDIARVVFRLRGEPTVDRART